MLPFLEAHLVRLFLFLGCLFDCAEHVFRPAKGSTKQCQFF